MSHMCFFFDYDYYYDEGPKSIDSFGDAIHVELLLLREVLQAGEHFLDDGRICQYLNIFDNIIEYIDKLIDHLNDTAMSFSKSLHMAAKRGDLNIIMCLVNNGANLADIEHKVVCRCYAIGSEEKTIKLFLKAKQLLSSYISSHELEQNVKERIQKRHTDLDAKLELLEEAARGSWNRGRRKLGKVDINARIRFYEGVASTTALEHASSVEVAELLLNSGADVNSRNDHGRTPLMSEKARRRADIAAVLLKNGAEVNAIDNYGRTALHYALSKRVLKLLLENGADTEIKDEEGETALFKAVKGKRFEYTAPILIRYGAHVDTSCKSGLPAIFYAKTKKTLKLLLKNGADVDAKCQGLTSLIIQGKNRLTGLLLILLKYDTNVNFRNFLGVTVFQISVKLNYLDIVPLLLRCKCDVNASDEYKQRALHVSRSGEMVNLLIKNGADIDAIDEDLGTALHTAAFLKRSDVASALLENGADVSLQDKDGCTALHHAIENNMSELVKMLIEKRSDLTIANKKKLTPLDYAKRHANPWLLEYIIHHTIKMKIAGLNMGKQNLVAVESISGDESEIDCLCKKELDRIRGHRLDNSMSLYRIFLAKDPQYASDRGLDDLESLDSFIWTNNYPLYGRLMKNKFMEDRRRAKLLLRGKNSLDVITNTNDNRSKFVLQIIPDEVVMRILSQLKDTELKRLIKFGKDIRRHL
ncbi:hypothetical protein SUGI_1511180 [Cryptomeria japonica]|uniref:F-box domain-containing protein n=1 Tax=Cryptomeria japonica TaxID=3369 RepID=A0AAD3NTL8_CRYJA|nr:uncharacterized protein LOC131873226 [Cryptomeria japonica]GLJ59496.1 hypothetical protein SUGI_1511180 [Cryptomeria japonica]